MNLKEKSQSEKRLELLEEISNLSLSFKSSERIVSLDDLNDENFYDCSIKRIDDYIILYCMINPQGSLPFRIYTPNLSFSLVNITFDDFIYETFAEYICRSIPKTLNKYGL